VLYRPCPRTPGWGGYVGTDIQGNHEYDFASALAVQADGKILVGGLTRGIGGPPTNAFALVRYKPSGQLDRSFGRRGVVITKVSSTQSDAIYGLAVQPDGKIIGAGSSGADIALARYDESGELDTSFGMEGIVTTRIGTRLSQANAVAVQPDGKIVVCGTTSYPDPNFMVARYNADGSLDSTFGEGGVALSHLGGRSNEANALILQENGRILLAGTKDFAKLALVRYTTQGTLDQSFGTGGIVFTKISWSTVANGIALQSSGRIVVGGSCGGAGGRDVVLVGYLP